MVAVDCFRLLYSARSQSKPHPVCQTKPEPIDFELMCKSGCSGDVQCQSQPLPNASRLLKYFPFGVNRSVFESF